MEDMGTTDGQPDIPMYGSTAPPTAAQVLAAAQLIKETDASLEVYANVQAAFGAGYTHALNTNDEEYLLYDGDDPRLPGPQPAGPLVTDVRNQQRWDEMGYETYAPAWPEGIGGSGAGKHPIVCLIQSICCTTHGPMVSAVTGWAVGSFLRRSARFLARSSLCPPW
jgi:hypothetical protein